MKNVFKNATNPKLVLIAKVVPEIEANLPARPAEFTVIIFSVKGKT